MAYGNLNGRSYAKATDSSEIAANAIRTVWASDMDMPMRVVAQGAALADVSAVENRSLEGSYLTNAPAVAADNLGVLLTTSANANYGFRVAPVLCETDTLFAVANTDRTDGSIQPFIAVPAAGATSGQATHLAQTFKTAANVASFEFSWGAGKSTNLSVIGPQFNSTNTPASATGLVTAAYFIFNSLTHPNWQCVTVNAAGTTTVTTDVPVEASKFYTLEIDLAANALVPTFSINGRIVATGQAMTASANLYPWIGGKTRAAAEKSIYMCSPLQIVKAIQ